jgi:peptidoglycan/xylan/chitin deacetylase (PgdA/CDA1 family)
VARSETLSVCYHAVSPTWPAALSVTPDNFSTQLEFFANHGYRGVTFSEVASGEARGKCISITFDDGYLSTLELARPILDRFEMPATIYVPTEYIGGGPMAWPGIDHWLGTEHEDELRPVSWEQLRELADAGWEVGSHTRTHPHLTSVSDEQLEDELVGSREVCEEKLDRPCRSIAYPYGDCDERVIGAAERAGYETGATLPERFLDSSPQAWPRLGVYHDDSRRRVRLKISTRNLRRSRIWGPLAAPARRITSRVRG